MRATLLALACSMLLGPTAEAGFFYHDRYEPPSPKFGTPYLDMGLFAGGWGSNTLDSEAMYAFSWNGIFGGSVMVLPMIKVGARAGAGSIGGARSDGVGSPRTGFRQRTAWTDATLELATPYLRVYAFHTLVAASNVRAPVWAFDEPGFGWFMFRERNTNESVGASYRHAGIGLVPRYLQPAKSSSPGNQTAGYGLALEVRRTWMTTNQMVSFAPNEAAGWLVLGTIAVDIRGNGAKK
jgi:hypothetical protein